MEPDELGQDTGQGGQSYSPTEQQQLAERHGGVRGETVISYPNRMIGGVQTVLRDTANPIRRVEYADGTYLTVQGERDASGAATGNWTVRGGNAGRPGRQTGQAHLQQKTITVDGQRQLANFNPLTGQYTDPDTGDPITGASPNITIHNAPRGRTAAQEAASWAQIEHAGAETDLARARMEQLGQKPTLDPDTAAHLQAQTREIEQKMLPKSQQMIQGHLDTIAYLRDMIAQGQMGIDDANSAAEQSYQNLHYGLQGTTAAEAEHRRQIQLAEQQRMGETMLNRRIQSGAQLAQSLQGDFTRMLTGAHPITTNPHYDPMQHAEQILQQFGGGPEYGDFARALLSGSGIGPPPGPSGVDWRQQLTGQMVQGPQDIGALPESAIMSTEEQPPEEEQ